MITLEFSTQDNKIPLFKDGKYNVSCFLDTGSNITIWNGSIKLLKEKFKECNPTDTGMKAPIGGFGIGEVEMPVYKLTNFELSDGTNTLTFSELYVAVEENRNRNFDLLLAYSMFKNINIVIRPTSKNRKIAFATDSKTKFKTIYKLSKEKKLIYTESYIQSITAQDVLANMVYELVEESKNNN